jgi:Fe-S cluster biogenesis protein NfuA
MSDTDTRRRIRAQASPRDRQVMRFILDYPVADGRSAIYTDGAGDAPLAGALFAVDGVTRVQVEAETVLVTIAAGQDWTALKAPVAAAIRAVLDSSDEPLGPSPAVPVADDGDAAMLAAVTELLDTRANPSIAGHGGKITAEAVQNGSVYLRMSGGCQGCAASAITLRKGVETMLRAALPAITEIVDVTDHAGGDSPFYAREPGQSPSFSRPVPADSIGWEKDQLVIDPDYMAGRLGMTPAELQKGLKLGEIVMTTQPSPGAVAERMRVIVRGVHRAWAADVMPDGSAQEVPPPRALSDAERAAHTLPGKVRQYLETLPAAKLPITYGRLARGMGLYLPGSVGKITDALDATMHQDADAGQPFIAARAVNRGSAQLPGKGFFDLARSLGRGPAAGETDAAFHARELGESLGSA